MPGYADICNDSHAYIVAAAATKVRGNPWQINGQVLETLASDVVTEIEKKLTSASHSSAQMIRDWFRTQRSTLVLLGVKIAWAAKELWEPSLAAGIPVELALDAIDRVMSALMQDNLSDATAIHEWYREYDRLVYVLGVSVTSALSFAGALGLIEKSTEGDGCREADDRGAEDEEGAETEGAVDEDQSDQDERDDAEAGNNEDEAGEDEDTEDRDDSGRDESDEADDGEPEVGEDEYEDDDNGDDPGGDGREDDEDESATDVDEYAEQQSWEEEDSESLEDINSNEADGDEQDEQDTDDEQGEQDTDDEQDTDEQDDDQQDDDE